jgi:hypothetical protein
MTKTMGSRAVRIVLLLSLVLGCLTLASPASAKALRTRNFQMPSKNIGCHVDGGVLRCDILSGLKPEPKRDCEQDWVGLLLRNKHRALANCAGDTVYKQNAPVLKYGHVWKSDRIHCVARTTGLRCDNSSGYGFKLAREDWDRFYHP